MSKVMRSSNKVELRRYRGPEKIELLMKILMEKKRFTLTEAEEIARQIVDERTVNYVVIEAINRLAQQTKLKIVIK